MAPNYAEITRNITLTGFFSEYLPPCFALDEKTLLKPPASQCDLIAPYSFTMSRHTIKDSRRNIFIPEIGAYILAQEYMKQQDIIKEIVEFTKEHGESSFSPIIGDADEIVLHDHAYSCDYEDFKSGDLGSDGSEIAISDYVANIVEKIIRSAGAKQILKLDISNCFSSFYMHMIPAILLGAEEAESEYKKYKKHIKNPNNNSISESYKKYHKLDAYIRRQNLNRTNGLLPGILSSKIIAEGILTRIDIELRDAKVKFSRYIDDYEVYIYNDETKETISIFNRILKRYGFTLNSEKTELLDFPYYIAENLEKIFRVYSNGDMNNLDIMELFDKFLSLEKNGSKGAVRYLLKSLESKPIKIELEQTSQLYLSYLLNIIANDVKSLPKACSLLISKNEKQQHIIKLHQKDIDIIVNILTAHIACEHDLEVIWLLYLLIETENIGNEKNIIKKISESNNELAQTMLLRKKLFSEQEEKAVSEQAKSWILLYELYSMNIINEETFKYKLSVEKNLKMYNYLKKKFIHFCYA